MRSPKTAAHIWYSEDGMTMFRTSQNGITDICPGPGKIWAEVMRSKKLWKNPEPYKDHKNHDHWV